MNKLYIKTVGKKQYYKDPLKGVLRNIENPKDILTPNTKAAISRMLENVREY